MFAAIDYRREAKHAAKREALEVELERMEEIHAEYKSCNRFWPVCPPVLTRKGVELKQVGRNASHFFYYGYKDGHRYRFSCAPDYDHVSDEHLERVKTWEGEYMGHY